jgi:hypothetical protein
MTTPLEPDWPVFRVGLLALIVLLLVNAAACSSRSATRAQAGAAASASAATAVNPGPAMAPIVPFDEMLGSPAQAPSATTAG